MDPQVIRGIESGALYAWFISVVACDGIHQSKLNKTLNSQHSQISTFLVVNIRGLRIVAEASGEGEARVERVKWMKICDR